MTHHCSKLYCGCKGDFFFSSIPHEFVQSSFQSHHENSSNTKQNLAQPEVKIFSAYLGEVAINGIDIGNGNIVLFSSVTGLDGREIYIKEVDAVLNGLNPDKNYTLRDLNNCRATMVNVARCAENALIISSLKNKSDRTVEEELKLDQAIVENAPVDIHFLTTKYIAFMHEHLQINNIDENGFLVSIHNVPKLDNAFFSGSYMLYGKHLSAPPAEAQMLADMSWDMVLFKNSQV